MSGARWGTYVLGGLQVDDDQPAPAALGGERQVPARPDLQGGAQRDGQVGVPGTGGGAGLSPSPRASQPSPLPPPPPRLGRGLQQPSPPPTRQPWEASSPRTHLCSQGPSTPASCRPESRPCMSRVPTPLAEAELLMWAGPLTLGLLDSNPSSVTSGLGSTRQRGHLAKASVSWAVKWARAAPSSGRGEDGACEAPPPRARCARAQYTGAAVITGK